jgi:hypothetical protein
MHKKKSRKKPLNKVFKASRWLHIYCSTALFALLVFFCITGIWLNHRWYDQENYQQHYSEYEITDELYLAWNLSPRDDWMPDSTAITNYLYDHYRLKGPASMDIDQDL